MRRLILIRHAKAEPAIGREDHERTLTDRGRADAKRMGAALADRRMIPELLVHSGAARARETAEIMAAEWPREIELVEDAALYDASERGLLVRAHALPDAPRSVGLVGHNPGLGELAAALIGSGGEPEARRLVAKFPPGAVAALDCSARRWKEVERKTALLALYLTPGELEAGAD